MRFLQSISFLATFIWMCGVCALFLPNAHASKQGASQDSTQVDSSSRALDNLDGSGGGSTLQPPTSGFGGEGFFDIARGEYQASQQRSRDYITGKLQHEGDVPNVSQMQLLGEEAFMDHYMHLLGVPDDIHQDYFEGPSHISKPPDADADTPDSSDGENTDGSILDEFKSVIPIA